VPFEATEGRYWEFAAVEMARPLASTTVPPAVTRLP
jgi:hypothetical protein